MKFKCRIWTQVLWVFVDFCEYNFWNIFSIKTDSLLSWNNWNRVDNIVFQRYRKVAPEQGLQLLLLLFIARRRYIALSLLWLSLVLVVWPFRLGVHDPVNFDLNALAETHKKDLPPGAEQSVMIAKLRILVTNWLSIIRQAPELATPRDNSIWLYLEHTNPNVIFCVSFCISNPDRFTSDWHINELPGISKITGLSLVERRYNFFFLFFFFSNFFYS